MSLPDSLKTVFVIDHGPDMTRASDLPIQLDVSRSHQVGASIPVTPVCKLLWTCATEASFEYCRIVWDTYPTGKLLRFVISDVEPHLVGSWALNHQNLNTITDHFAQLGVPIPDAGDSSILNGLTAALESLTECSDSQLENMKSPESRSKVLNMGRVICISSFRENCFNRLESFFQETILKINERKFSPTHMPIHHCDLVVLNIFPNPHIMNPEDNPRFGLRLTRLLLQHSGMPMMEDENSTSSPNHGVEIFHSVAAPTDLLKLKDAPQYPGSTLAALPVPPTSPVATSKRQSDVDSSLNDVMARLKEMCLQNKCDSALELVSDFRKRFPDPPNWNKIKKTTKESREFILDLHVTLLHSKDESRGDIIPVLEEYPLEAYYRLVKRLTTIRTKLEIWRNSRQTALWVSSCALKRALIISPPPPCLAMLAIQMVQIQTSEEVANQVLASLINDNKQLVTSSYLHILSSTFAKNGYEELKRTCQTFLETLQLLRTPQQSSEKKKKKNDRQNLRNKKKKLGKKLQKYLTSIPDTTPIPFNSDSEDLPPDITNDVLISSLIRPFSQDLSEDPSQIDKNTEETGTKVLPLAVTGDIIEAGPSSQVQQPAPLPVSLIPINRKSSNKRVLRGHVRAKKTLPKEDPFETVKSWADGEALKNLIEDQQRFNIDEIEDRFKETKRQPACCFVIEAFPNYERKLRRLNEMENWHIHENPFEPLLTI